MRMFFILMGLGVFAPNLVFGFNEIPVDQQPLVGKKLNRVQLLELGKLLGANRWVANRFCRVKADLRNLDRKFLGGTFHDDALFVEFETDQLGPRKASGVITTGLSWGSRQTLDPEVGPVEDVRINLDDKNSTWIQFRHTGSRLVQFEIGNTMGITPCLIR